MHGAGISEMGIEGKAGGATVELVKLRKSAALR